MAKPPGTDPVSSTGADPSDQAAEALEEAQSVQTATDEPRRAPANPPTGTSTADREPAGTAAGAAPRAAAPHVGDFVEHARQALRQAELVPTDWEGDPIERIRALGSEVRNLRSWASIGEAARAELVQTIEAEGVRAYGADGLPKPVYQRLLDTGSWEELTGLRDHLRAVSKAHNFPGGRQTTEERETETEDTEELVTAAVSAAVDPPDSVFRARY